MQECLIRALSSRRRLIHRRWEDLLRMERAETPLANPEALVHLIDWTLEKIFGRLHGKKAPFSVGLPPRAEALRAHCSCGRNPFFKHFLAGEQALLEALVLAQKEDPNLDPVLRDSAVAELYLVVNELGRCEVELLCSLCENPPRPRTSLAGLSVSTC